MAKVLQFRRGDTATLNGITGASGELFVDTDTNTIQVHDGSTPGGHSLAKTSDLGPVAGADYASQAEAEAGTAADKVMSPLLTAQAIAALASGGGGGSSETLLAHELILEQQKNTTITVTDAQSTTTATTGTIFHEWYDDGYGWSNGYPAAIGDTVEFYMYNWSEDWNDSQYTTNTEFYFWKAWQVGDIIEFASDVAQIGQPDLDNLTGTDFIYGKFLITNIDNPQSYNRIFTLEVIDWNDNGYGDSDYFWWNGLSYNYTSIRTNTESTQYSYTFDSLPANGTYSYLNTSNNAPAYILSPDGLAFAEVANSGLLVYDAIHWEPTQAFKDYKNDQTLEGKCISSTDDWTLEFTAYFPVDNSETNDPQSIYFQNTSTSQTEFKWEYLFSLGRQDGQLLDQFVQYSQGDWHHFAVAYNSASDTAYGYVDGELKVTYPTASGINIFSNTNTLNAIVNNSEPYFYGSNPYLKGVRFTIGQNTPYIDGAATQVVPEGLVDITNVSQNLYTLCLYSGRTIVPVKGTSVSQYRKSLPLDIGQLIYDVGLPVEHCLTALNQITFAGQNPVTTTQNQNLATNDVLEVPETTIGLYFGSAGSSDAFTYDLLKGELTTPIEPPTVYAGSDNSISSTIATSTQAEGVGLGMSTNVGVSGVGVGRNANASGNSSISIGSGSKAYSASGVAIGENAEASSTYSIAIGKTTYAKMQSISLSAYGSNSYGANDKSITRIQTNGGVHVAMWSSTAGWSSSTGGQLDGNYYIKRNSSATSFVSSSADYINPISLFLGTSSLAVAVGTCNVVVANSNGSIASWEIKFILRKSSPHGSTIEYAFNTISTTPLLLVDNEGGAFGSLVPGLDVETTTGLIRPSVYFASYDISTVNTSVMFNFYADILRTW